MPALTGQSIRLVTRVVGWCTPVVVCAALVLEVVSFPQADAQRGRGRGSDYWIDMPERDIFPGEDFTFCRIRYSKNPFLHGPGWTTDYPDSDMNFSQRLEELTTIKVNRDAQGRIQHAVVDLMDEALFDYPFIYMIEVGALQFSDEEVERLREYLLRGGFLMVDDFWGTEEWFNWEMEISRVLPPEQFPMQELDIEHPVFNCVFKLKEKPQIPSLYHWTATGGLTSERGMDSATPHYKGIHDQNGRLMVMVCHNTDLGDGWEREGENKGYFEQLSAPKAYPMGINIVVYAMTH